MCAWKKYCYPQNIEPFQTYKDEIENSKNVGAEDQIKTWDPKQEVKQHKAYQGNCSTHLAKLGIVYTTTKNDDQQYGPSESKLPF